MLPTCGEKRLRIHDLGLAEGGEDGVAGRRRTSLEGGFLEAGHGPWVSIRIVNWGRGLEVEACESHGAFLQRGVGSLYMGLEGGTRKTRGNGS